MHANYFIAQYDYIGYASPIDDRSAWGISLIRFGVDDILNTTELIEQSRKHWLQSHQSFSTADYGFTFSYARNYPFPFQYGVNAKIIRRIIGNLPILGVGFDVGLQFERMTGNSD
jgi:hypothetical protein